MPEELSAANVVVVGAGVVGCSIAFHLARAGARVSVFDKGAICAGMSARSGALVRMHYTFKPEAELAWKSLGYFENWGDVVGGSCGFVRTGFSLIVAEENADKLRRNVAMLKSIGVETEVIERGELKRLEPAAFVDDVALAAYEPRSGYADPVATTESFAAAARASGANFNLNMPISALVHVAGDASAQPTHPGRPTRRISSAWRWDPGPMTCCCRSGPGSGSNRSARRSRFLAGRRRSCTASA